MKKFSVKLLCLISALCIALPVLTSCNGASPTIDVTPSPSPSDNQYFEYAGAKLYAGGPDRIARILRENEKERFLGDYVSGIDVLDFINNISLEDYTLSIMAVYEDLVTEVTLGEYDLTPVNYEYIIIK